MNVFLLAGVILAASDALGHAALQQRLESAKAHYAAAAYEEALSELSHAEPSTVDDRVEVEQYRALCLIALGRTPEAERAVAAMTDANPEFLLSSDIASPRVISLVADMRRKQLPATARRLLDSGRAAFDAGDHRAAKQRFEKLLRLLDADVGDALQEREDLRALARGFLALGEAAMADRRGRDASHEPAAASAQRTGEATGPPPAAPAIVAAVAIDQTIPSWTPPDVTTGSRNYRGAVRVRIGADGAVTSVRIEETSHPAFDARLLKAAEKWRYRPATRDGVPVESEKVLIVQLSPDE